MTCPSCLSKTTSTVRIGTLAICDFCLSSIVIEGTAKQPIVRRARHDDIIALSEQEQRELRTARTEMRQALGIPQKRERV